MIEGIIKADILAGGILDMVFYFWSLGILLFVLKGVINARYDHR